MKFIKLLCITFALNFISSCVVLTPKQYEAQKKAQALKDNKSELHQILLNKDKNNEACDISTLLKLLENNINRLSNATLDEFRINVLKDELIKSYKMHKNKELAFVSSDKDLEAKMSCYLDYILNPKFEYVPFWIFWKEGYYLKFPCKN